MLVPVMLPMLSAVMPLFGFNEVDALFDRHRLTYDAPWLLVYLNWLLNNSYRFLVDLHWLADYLDWLTIYRDLLIIHHRFTALYCSVTR